MKYNEEDNELISIMSEDNEIVREELYNKFQDTIKYLVNKYTNRAIKLGLETSDLYQEARLGFTDAINNYDDMKEASLKTFISLCIERRLQKVLLKAQRLKDNLEQDILSLDYEYDKSGIPLKEMIPTEDNDPLLLFSEIENLESIENKIKTTLSSFEFLVYTYLKEGLKYQEIAKKLDKSPKQVDNTIQRLRGKIRLILRGNKDE